MAGGENGFTHAKLDPTANVNKPRIGNDPGFLHSTLHRPTIMLEDWMITEAIPLMPRIHGVLKDTADELDQLKMAARM